MREVTRHAVSGRRMTEALEDIHQRARGRRHGLRYGDASPLRLREMGDELVEHVAARTVREPLLDETSRAALRTAAECALGALSIGCFPDGDQEVFFPLIDEELTSEDVAFADVVDHAPTARTWLDAFELCLVGGLVWDWQRAIGLTLRGDCASAVRDGVPYPRFTQVSDPADLAAMDALCGYLTEAEGHLPRDWPAVPLCKPDDDARAEAARSLDAAGPVTPDQRLLRILLDDDRARFEEALADRLVEHRQGVGADPSAATLLPLGVLALAVLAVQVHGWELGVRSGYLPPDLLGSPEALQQADALGVNDLGYWAAK
ncbi:immunity 49 family protein [Streptomyces sp. NPDC014006]|uniref:immunity 49 family protein n=1 Tax=Streptomyces sp. NPDC014006 TaxID=3364870 RepID=UPI0036F59D31